MNQTHTFSSSLDRWEAIRRRAACFGVLSSIAAVSLLVPHPVKADTFNLTQTFNNPTPAANDLFGTSVAISGNLVLIGAHLDDTSATDAGSAYLFDVTTGNLLQTFSNPTPVASARFGESVAISGNNALIGAPLRFGAGSVYLFDVTTGNLLQTFSDPAPAGYDRFGESVAINGNNALIGAPLQLGSGRAYLFNVTTGTLLQTFNNPTPTAPDFFGNSVAISGNKALIGAIFDDTGGISTGSAYLFDVTTGNLLQTFNNPSPATGDQFGYSVAISGTNVLISARNDNTGAVEAGSAYLFDASSGALLQTFNNPSPAAQDQFGQSVAISGEYVLIGNVGDDTGAIAAGNAYLFDATTGNLLQTFNNPTPSVSDLNFGESVAINSNNVLIGAPLDETGASDAGSVYLYSIQVQEVPGPLPLLGAGAAFGWSRKLRRRIGMNRSALG
jgi:outer membrane protein assembly factor BamB